MAADHNKLKVFGKIGTDVINGYSTADAETGGFIQEQFIYVDQINTALRNASLVTYSLVDILNPSADIAPDTEVGDGTTSGAEYTIKIALDKYIRETEVDNARNARNLDNKNIGDLKTATYFLSGLPQPCGSILDHNISGVAASANKINNNPNPDLPGIYKTIFDTLLDLVYPVGSIYMSTNNVSPQTFLGGTWTQITGTFLVAAGENQTTGLNFSGGNTGGNKDLIIPYHNHTIDSISLDFSHNHSASFSGSRTSTESDGAHTHYVDIYEGKASGGDYASVIRRNSDGFLSFITRPDGSHSHRFTPSGSVTVSSKTLTTTFTPNIHAAGTEGNATNANLPPYLAVYMWKRTA